VIAAAKQFSVNVQAKDTTVGDGWKGAKLLSTYYSSMRKDEKFVTFYTSIVSSSEIAQMIQFCLDNEEGLGGLMIAIIDNYHDFATPEDMLSSLF